MVRHVRLWTCSYVYLRTCACGISAGNPGGPYLGPVARVGEEWSGLSVYPPPLESIIKSTIYLSGKNGDVMSAFENFMVASLR